ncbi:MAG: hypothetical protein U0641_12135 [Anaerolineae bacterium]
MLEVADRIGNSVFCRTLDDEVDMVGHYHETEQSETPLMPHAITGVEEETLHHIAAEYVGILGGLSCHEVEMLRVEVGPPS